MDKQKLIILGKNELVNRSRRKGSIFTGVIFKPKRTCFLGKKIAFHSCTAVIEWQKQITVSPASITIYFRYEKFSGFLM